MHSPMGRHYSALPGGKAVHDAFVQRTVRPEAFRITKLSSIKRDLVLLIIGLWKAEERITATWLASELNMPRRNFYRHPVTKRWKSIARELVCNTAHMTSSWQGNAARASERRFVCRPRMMKLTSSSTGKNLKQSRQSCR